MNNTNLTPSDTCYRLIKHFEELRLEAYLCPANKLTIGYGHVIMPSWDSLRFSNCTQPILKRLKAECESQHRVTREAKEVLVITTMTADLLLLEDARQVSLFLGSVTQTPLNQNQFDALCSLVFNIGQANYATSTLKKDIAKGDFKHAASEFDRWIYRTVKGKKVRTQGLVNRRADERKLFEAL